MKRTIIVLIPIILLSISIMAQTNEDKSWNEYISGQVTKYSSYGYGKANGLKLHFKYPKSWKSIEGERPHVVRKFMQNDNSVISILMVNKLHEKFTQHDTNELLTIHGLKLIIPSTGKYISSTCNLEIEGLRAGSVEYTNEAIRMDREFYSYNINYVFLYNEYFISIHCMVLNSVGESNLSVLNRYKKVKPLFYQMVNSIVIDNIWE